jgi:predicted ATPase/class 3 adenylate cyclase/DNA-binding CsgD family transcriptional regulator
MDAREAAVGVVTFLLTDVVASTRLWRESPLAGRTVARQAELIAAAIAQHRGVRPPDQGEGDSTLAVFSRPGDALSAALDAQREIARERWPDGAQVSVRMAVHSGEAEVRDGGNYGGLAIIRAARIRALAHGGQILVSSATVALAQDTLPEGASLAELGSVSLRGFERPERVHQLSHADLPVQAGRLGALRANPAMALGPWPTSLVGRERERRDVDELLATNRIVTITGAGGAGKTRLAHAVAHDRIDLHADGVVWVELARIADGAQVSPAIVAACGLVETPGATPLEVLTHRLARADVLIVLDNCEHLLGACAELADALVRAGPDVRVLATGREPLGVSGETMWRIPSLSVAPEEERSLERIASFDAVKLFVERARASRADFQLDPANAPLVARICRRLDGIPLALELAAARVRALSIERLAEGLDDRFRLLTGGARTAMARQRTLLASVEWSYDLLEPAEQALFRRLAVFASPFSLEAAEAVAADENLDRLEVFDLLARLVDKSLVQHSGDRYRMLETLRQYGLERADDARELALVRDRHLGWFRRRAEGWATDREVATVSVVAEIAAEIPDLIAAVDWSLGLDRVPAIDLLQPLSTFWLHRFAIAEGRAVSARVLACFEPGSRAWLEALAPVGIVLVIGGDIALVPAARKALEKHGTSLSRLAHSQIEGALSRGLTFLGRREGVEGLQRTIESARAAGNRAVEVAGTFALAMDFTNRDLRRARPLVTWLDRHAPADASIRRYIDLATGIVALFEADFATARTLIGRAPSGPGSLRGLALLGLYTEDRAVLEEALVSLERTGALGVFEGFRSVVLGVDAILAGDLEAARERLPTGSHAPGLFRWEVQLYLVAVALALGNTAEAAVLLTELDRGLADTDLHLLLAGCDVLRAHLARERSATEAESAAHAALARAAEFGFPLCQIDALETLAVLAGDAGALAEAGRLLGAVDAFRSRTGYRFRHLYLRLALEELRGKLDAASFEEGARLSLEEAVEYARRGRGERGRPDRGWESLTPAEARVVELVSEGLPNKEIAQKLFVSTSTVKTHLVHVYGKLDVRTRAELAAEAARRAARA